MRIFVAICILVAIPHLARSADLDFEKTDEERIDDYKDCVETIRNEHLRLGSGFILDLLEGNYPVAVFDWAKFVLTASSYNKCMDLLSPAQRAAVIAEALRHQRTEWNDNHHDRRN
jgi:hypothetical protein